MNIDYSHIWKDAPLRDQGPVGNCHSFTTVALLEARYYKENYIYRALSPYDLFVNHMLASSKIFKAQPFMSHPLQEFVLFDGSETMEAGDDFTNLKLVKKYGLPLDLNRPYPKPGSAQMKTLLKNIETNTRIWRLAFWEQHTLDLEASVFKAEKVRKLIAKLYHDEALTGFIEDDARELYKEDRENIKSFVNGLSLKKVSYLGFQSHTKKKRLVSYLKCNPVLVSIKNYEKLDLKGNMRRPNEKISSRKSDAKDDSLHSVVLIGFLPGTNEFLVKNSWGLAVERFNADKFAQKVHDAAYLRRAFEKTRDCTFSENPIRFHNEY